LAELASPDMQCPIANSMSWPNRLKINVAPLDFVEIGKLEFYKPDLHKFKALALSYDALQAGGIMPAVLNASNEIAVGAYAKQQIAFLDIPVIIEKVLNSIENESASSIECIIEADRRARELALQLVG